MVYIGGVWKKRLGLIDGLRELHANKKRRVWW